MYTSYSGMRSTGGGVVPSARRFRRWVLVATPSLGTLMQLPVGIVLLVLAAGPLLPEPGVEARWHEAIGSLLPLGGAGREKIGVLVLCHLVVAAHPFPHHGQPLVRLVEFLPQQQVLDLPAFALPPACLPARQPFRDAFDEILGIRDVADPS